MSDLSRISISPRLRGALVADYLMDDLSEVTDHWLHAQLRDPREWTAHLARQLKMKPPEYVEGLHDTLLLVAQELDEMLKTWPLRCDAQTCKSIAHEATKALDGLELHAMILGGPPQWRQQTLPGCKVVALVSHLQPIVEKGLAAELSRVLEQWGKWDVRNIQQRRRDAVRTGTTGPAAAPPSPHSTRKTAAERRDRPVTAYRPPGRT